MNILELKLQMEDALIEAKESGYDVKTFSLVGMVDNNVISEGITIDNSKPTLVLESIGRGKLPSGSCFILIELKNKPGLMTPWEETIEHLDKMMDEVPLNAPVLFTFNGQIVYLWSTVGVIGISADEELIGVFNILLFDSKCPLYKKINNDQMASLGLSTRKPQKGLDFFG